MPGPQNEPGLIDAPKRPKPVVGDPGYEPQGQPHFTGPQPNPQPGPELTYHAPPQPGAAPQHRIDVLTEFDKWLTGNPSPDYLLTDLYLGPAGKLKDPKTQDAFHAWVGARYGAQAPLATQLVGVPEKAAAQLGQEGQVPVVIKPPKAPRAPKASTTVSTGKPLTTTAEHVAQLIAKGTGLDTNVVRAWVAEETGFGTSRRAVQDNNFLGLGVPANSSVSRYASPEVFAQAAIDQLKRRPEWYGKILAATKKSPLEQMAAIADSPWAASHYGTNGSELIARYNEVTGGGGNVNYPPVSIAYPLGPGWGQSSPTPSGIEHGQDIRVPDHTQLYAPAGGEVISAGENSVTGGTVALKVGGYVYWFGHLAQINVHKGMKVGSGKFLGLTGGAAGDPMRGDATGAHMWFGVSTGNDMSTLINPSGFINQNAMWTGQGGGSTGTAYTGGSTGSSGGTSTGTYGGNGGGVSVSGGGAITTGSGPVDSFEAVPTDMRDPLQFFVNTAGQMAGADFPSAPSLRDVRAGLRQSSTPTPEADLVTPPKT